MKVTPFILANAMNNDVELFRLPYEDDDLWEFQLSDFERKFLTIPEMVHHYTKNRLLIKGAEHMCLKKPTPIQLLWTFN